MGEVARTDDPRLLSISQASRLTGKARETVAKIIADAGLQPAPGKNRTGYAVYYSYELLPVIYAAPVIRMDDEDFDPAKLPPQERRHFYASEKDRIAVEEKQQSLIPREAYRADLATVLKSLVSFFETLPDILERDCGLSGPAVDRLQEVIDIQRDDLSAQLSDLES